MIMVSLNELCDRVAGLATTTAAVRQVCALPRSPADARPLPEPHAEFPFDSAWEALFAGADLAEMPENGLGR
jgi:hypothetical protein